MCYKSDWKKKKKKKKKSIYGNEGVLHIFQRSKTEASLSDGLVSCPEHLLGFYASAEMWSVYSTASPPIWALN